MTTKAPFSIHLFTDPRGLAPQTSDVWSRETSLEEARVIVTTNESNLFESFYAYAAIVKDGVPLEWYRAIYKDGSTRVESCPDPDPTSGFLFG